MPPGATTISKKSARPLRSILISLLSTLPIRISSNENSHGRAVVVNALVMPHLSIFNSPPGRSKIKPPIPISDEIGTSPAFNNQFFDPLNLSNEYNFAQYREAELKHGRVAMVAVLGNTLPDIFREQLVPPEGVLLSPSAGLLFVDVPNGLSALKTVPFFGWVQVLLLVAFLETQVFVQRDKRDLPGDYGLGYFGLRDKARHER